MKPSAVIAGIVLVVVCSLSVRSEEVGDELQELRLSVQALRQQNLSLQKQLQQALMKIEVLNLKDARSGPGGSFSEKNSGSLRGVPETPEELRWQMLTTLRLLRREQLANDELEQRLRKVTLLAGEAVKSAEKVDPKKRSLLEDEMRSVRSLLGPLLLEGREEATAESRYDINIESLKRAKVSEIRKDLSMVVLNVGAEHGVKPGMPFDIIRDNKLVATVYVVEVRDKLCGALIERMEESNPVKVEDLAVLRKS